MIIEIHTIVLPVAVALLVTGVPITLLGHRLLSRLDDVEETLAIADERLDTLAAILNEELGTLRHAGEGQVRRLERLGRQVEQVSVDIVRREARGGEARLPSGDVAVAARGGQGVEELVREHGLSAEEAELLVMLHGGTDASVERAVR
mgnify:CR=1 FL=1